MCAACMICLPCLWKCCARKPRTAPSACSGGVLASNLSRRNLTALREVFLAHYTAHICDDTTLFPGMVQLLDTLEQRGLPWGIYHSSKTAPLHGTTDAGTWLC